MSIRCERNAEEMVVSILRNGGFPETNMYGIRIDTSYTIVVGLDKEESKCRRKEISFH